MNKVNLFSHGTIKKQMFTMGIILFFLLGLSIALVFLIFGFNNEKKDMFRDLNTSTTIQQMYIDGWLDNLENEIDFFAQSLKKIDMVEYDKNLSRFLERNTDLYNIMYIDNKGNVISHAGPQYNYNSTSVINCEHYQRALSMDRYTSDIVINEESDKPRIYISSSIKGEDGEVIGVLISTIMIDKIEEIVDFFILNKNADMYVVNKEGYMITKSKGIKDIYSINDNGEIIGFSTLVKTDIINQAHNHKKLENPYKNYNNQQVLGDYVWIGNGKWLLIAEITISQTFQGAKEYLYIFIVLSLLIISIFGITIYKVTNRFIKPINRLVEGANLINEGNYDYQINVDLIKKAPVEIKTLCDDFNQMTETIRETIVLLRKNEEKLTRIMEAIPSGLIIYNAKGNIMFVNNTAENILNISKDNLYNFEGITKAWTFLTLNGEALPEEEYPFMKVMKQKASIYNNEFILVKNNRQRKILSVNGTPLYNINNEIDNVLITLNDITKAKKMEIDLKKANEKLESLSYIDALTEIPNRRRFEETYKEEWGRAARNNSYLAVILIDIDNFKAYNDNYGHQAGDICLKKVANETKLTLNRPGDFVGRYGGEEFIVILPETNEYGAINIAEKLRQNIEELRITHEYSEISPYVTISLGVAIEKPSKRTNSYNLIKKADDALYKAKNNGRNQISIFKS